MRDLYDVNGTRLNVPQTYTDYIVGPDMIRRPVKLTRLGLLQNVQSFLIYNGHYYSADHLGNIAEQDGNFTVLRTAVISIGHANALQLGSNGIAYASGWDDNKVYIVDLATLTVTGTINLPTTGTTDAMVDEDRGLIYILQRDDALLTDVCYNFIVYDYVNEQVISTRKTDYKFAALQSCDYYNGRIIVTSGGDWTHNIEDKFHVLDTDGNTLAEYHFGSRTNDEPEGVFIDRNTQELFISFRSEGEKYWVYRITE